MRDYGRTDLACEAPRTADRDTVRYSEYHRGAIRVEEMRVTEETGGRAPGRYATLHCAKLWEMDKSELAAAADTAAEVIRSFLGEALGAPPRAAHGILVAGLGNRFITADSIGPRTADLVTVTNHASGEDTVISLLGCCRVSALAPGVLGQTGLEAAELIRRAAAAAQADAIIAVDALAARSTARLGTTVQISDTGIRPGSGIGNHRSAVTAETMGIPVIAAGVPTVVDSATLIWDALREAGITEPDEALEAALRDGRRYIVSPRESDLIAAAVAEVLGGALNRVLTPALL